MKIITSLYIDKNDLSSNPQLYHLDYACKRLAYWQCCSTFFATSVKVNPGEHHVLYTNDVDDVVFEGVSIKKFLIELGVDIVYLPMRNYKVPSKHSTFLSGAFYKLEVIQKLGEDNNEDVCLLDSDCVWIKSCDLIKNIVQDDKIILFDVYKLKDLDTLSPHGTSRREMFNVFKKVSADYSNSAPVRFGGEIIAANAKNIKTISQKLIESYTKLIHDFDELPKFSNGKKFMDGMEVFTSFVYNLLPMEQIDSENVGILRRIWTAPNVNNVTENDLNLMIWHLIAEKHRGIPVLSKELLKKDSIFWKLEEEKIAKFLGGYLGVPKRIIKIKEQTFFEKLMPSIKYKIKKKLTGFGINL